MFNIPNTGFLPKNLQKYIRVNGTVESSVNELIHFI